KHLRDPAGAAEHFAEAVRLHPTNLQALRQLAQIQWEGERWENVAQTLSRLASLEREPGRGRGVYFKLGILYADHISDAGKAASFYARALSLVPNDREILLRLSNLFFREKDYPNALKATRRLIDIEPSAAAQVDLLIRLSEIYIDGFRETRHAAEAL